MSIRPTLDLNPFAGMSVDALNAALASAQTAYINLSTGQSVREVYDSNGEKVTFTSANSGGLLVMIRQIQSAIAKLTQTHLRTTGPGRPIF